MHKLIEEKIISNVELFVICVDFLITSYLLFLGFFVMLLIRVDVDSVGKVSLDILF